MAVSVPSNYFPENHQINVLKIKYFPNYIQVGFLNGQHASPYYLY